MNKKRLLLCGVLSLTMILSACAKKSSESAASGSMPASPTEMKAVMQKNEAMNIGSQNSMADTKTTSTNSANSEQKIIKNGDIYIVEENLIKLAENIQQKTKELGGYIESEQRMEYRLTTTVRIPAEKFDEFIKYAETGYDVKNKNISSQNITDAYVDNDARLNNLKAQEKQILSILEKAKTVEEVLKVQDELYKIRGEVESLEARKKSWDKQIDYATLIINADKKQIVSDNKKSIISGSEFIKSIGKGFGNTWVSMILFIQQLFIFLISNIIIIGILAALAVFGYKKYKKYNNQQKK